MTEQQIADLIERAEAGDIEAHEALIRHTARCLAEMAGLPFDEQ